MSTEANAKKAGNNPLLATESPLSSEELGEEITETSDTTEASSPPGSLYTKDELQQLIATAAYHKAQKRGFGPGYEDQDWITSEQEILRQYVDL